MMQVYCTNCGATAVGTPGAECPESCGGNCEAVPTFSAELAASGRKMALGQIEVWAAEAGSESSMVHHYRKVAEDPVACRELAEEFSSGGMVRLANGELNPFGRFPQNAVPAEDLPAVPLQKELEIVMTLFGHQDLWVGQAIRENLFVDVPVCGKDPDKVYATVLKRIREEDELEARWEAQSEKYRDDEALRRYFRERGE